MTSSTSSTSPATSTTAAPGAASSPEAVDADRAADVAAIQADTHRYALGLDRHDPQLAIGAFTDDAVWDATAFGLERLEGRDQVLAFFERDAQAVAEQYHVITNHRIAFDGPDDAVGTNYVVSEGVMVSGAAFKAVGLNEDRYRRTGDGWRIASRSISPLVAPQMEGFDA
jgi:ketosteroid isomerase-like protein